AWAPKPQADADYAQFVKETGFDYERDLNRAAIAVLKHGQDSTLFTVLDGKFDRQKISAYALKDGSSAKAGGLEIFSVPITGAARKISFTFLKSERIAVTNGPHLVDVMNGVVILAEGGLNDVRTRQQIDPAMREAYLELLKSADVSKIDRGDTKSVRLVFEITPTFLDAARKAPPVIPDSTPNKRLPGKATTPRKGHT